MASKAPRTPTSNIAVSEHDLHDFFGALVHERVRLRGPIKWKSVGDQRLEREAREQPSRYPAAACDVPARRDGSGDVTDL